MVVALSTCQCTAIHEICQLSLSVRGYLRKPAQNRPQMRKKLLQKCFVHCNHYCKITPQISILDRFFMDVRAKGHMVLFNFFPPF